MDGTHQRRRAIGFGLVGIDAERQEVLDGRAITEYHGFRERRGLVLAEGRRRRRRLPAASGQGGECSDYDYGPDSIDGRSRSPHSLPVLAAADSR
jgi:hypothetical protein